MLVELAALPPKSRVALTIPPEHESLLNVRQLLKFLFGRDDIKIDSSLTSDYLSRITQDREFMALPLFGPANWMVFGRGLSHYGELSDQERLLTKIVETTPQQWQLVDRIEPTQRYFRTHLNPNEPIAFSYEWRLYQSALAIPLLGPGRCDASIFGHASVGLIAVGQRAVGLLFVRVMVHSSADSSSRSAGI